MFSRGDAGFDEKPPKPFEVVGSPMQFPTKGLQFAQQAPFLLVSEKAARLHKISNFVGKVIELMERGFQFMEHAERRLEALSDSLSVLADEIVQLRKDFHEHELKDARVQGRTFAETASQMPQ